MASTEVPTSHTVPEVQQRLEKNVTDTFGSRVSLSKPMAWKEYGLTFEVKREDAFQIFKTLKEDSRFDFNMLMEVTAVDWLDRREPRFDVWYHLLSTTHRHRISIRIHVSEESPEVDSVLPLWKSANFMEREVWDMYGIVFKGHGDLRRILMYDEFVGHPLRKDYPIRGKQPRVPLRIPELRNTSADMEREQLVSLPVRPGGGEKRPQKNVQ